MSSIIPDSVSGGVSVRANNGSTLLRPDVQNAYNPNANFKITCGLNYLPSDCSARITSSQINAFQSELLALAEKLKADGEWKCDSLTNLSDLFQNWWDSEVKTKISSTRRIIAGDGLVGGGDLSQDRTIALSEATKTTLKKAESAVQPSGLPDISKFVLNLNGEAKLLTSQNPTFCGYTYKYAKTDEEWEKLNTGKEQGYVVEHFWGENGNEAYVFSVFQGNSSEASITVNYGNPNYPWTSTAPLRIIGKAESGEDLGFQTAGMLDAEGEISGYKWRVPKSGGVNEVYGKLSFYITDKIKYACNTDNHVAGNINPLYTAVDKAVLDKLSKVSAISNAGVMEYIATLKTPNGRLKLNGGVYERATYPELWAVIETSDILVDDAAWLTGDFGKFSRGNGSTTFRVMDTRGHTMKVFDDGRGVDMGRVAGSYQGDAIRNITAKLSAAGAVPWQAPSGAFALDNTSAYRFSNPSTPITGVTLTFDASTVVPTASEVRVKNIAYPQYIRYI